MGLLGKGVRGVCRLFDGKLACQPLFERLYELSLNGMNFGRGDEIAYSGELQLLRYVSAQLGNEQRRIVVFDVGANVGNYTKAVRAALPKDNAVVFAFEPSEETYKQLSANVGNLNSVRIFNIGLSDRNATHELYTDQALSGIASVYPRKLGHRNLVMDKVETIALRTLDDFCREQGVQEIDFLKLDVEGHELSVLQGGKGMMREGKIRFIQFEFGGCNIDSRTFFKDFFELLHERYGLYRIVKNGIHPIRQYKESYEVFTTINYFAELRR